MAFWLAQETLLSSTHLRRSFGRTDLYRHRILCADAPCACGSPERGNLEHIVNDAVQPDLDHMRYQGWSLG